MRHAPGRRPGGAQTTDGRTHTLACSQSGWKSRKQRTDGETGEDAARWEQVQRDSQIGDPDLGLGCHTCPCSLTPAVPSDRSLAPVPPAPGAGGVAQGCYVFHSHFERAATALPATPDLSLTPAPPAPRITSPALTSCLQGLGEGEISRALQAAPAWGPTGRAGQAASLESAHDSPGGQGPGWHPGGNAASPG